MNRPMVEELVGTGTQATTAVTSNVILFIRRSELSEKTGVHNRQHSTNVGGLDRSSMKTMEKVSPELIGSNPAIRRDRVDGLRQRLRTGSYNISADQIAKSVLKKQLLAQVLESSEPLPANVLGTSVTWSRNPVTDQAS